MTLDSRPRLAARARLRWDRHAAQWLLLYPERGLALNATGAEILGLCTGERSVRDIIQALAERHGSHSSLSDDVQDFLQRLADRNLLRGLEP